MKLNSCPYGCGEFQGISPVDKKFPTPKPGDMSICTKCKRLIIFKSVDPMKYRKPTRKEYREAMDDPNVARAIACADEMHEAFVGRN